MPVLSLILFIASGLGCGQPVPYKASYAVQVQWLADRMVPNQVVPDPFPSRRNLVLSYAVPATDPAYRYLYAKSCLYDNAMAAIALGAAGRWVEARRILLGMAQLIRPDSSLWFNYHTTMDWPNEQDRNGALVRTGALAWMGYAFCFYLENCPDLATDHPDYRQCLAGAGNLAGYILRHTVQDPASPLKGLVTGGSSEWVLKVSPEQTVVEDFKDTPMTWASTEHNIDCHLFLSHYSRLTRQEEYGRTARTMAERLVQVLWSPRHQQFLRGIKADGTLDTALALDCASWGTLFLRNIGETKLAKACVQAMEQRYRTIDQGMPGYLPYAGTLVYEDTTVNAFYYPREKRKQWGSFPFVWTEGGYGAALAWQAMGQTRATRDLVSAWAPLYAAGGIVYCTQTLPYQFSAFKSAASTAWHVILVSLLTKKPLPVPFFSAIDF